MIMTPLYPLGSSPTEKAPQRWALCYAKKGGSKAWQIEQ